MVTIFIGKSQKIWMFSQFSAVAVCILSYLTFWGLLKIGNKFKCKLKLKDYGWEKGSQVPAPKMGLTNAKGQAVPGQGQRNGNDLAVARDGTSMFGPGNFGPDKFKNFRFLSQNFSRISKIPDENSKRSFLEIDPYF